MKNIKKLIISCVIASTSLTTFAYDNADKLEESSYTIYLVRHAEKQIIAGERNPELTQCGIKRAEQLASILDNVNLVNVYSTSYKRTMATAEPTAQQKHLTIKNYDPRELTTIATQLISEKKNALVVGHSNTTPQLTELLSKQAVKGLTELEFQELYQVQITANERILTRLKQPLECQ
ncbi:MAG: phosphohistidine phosphatase SixA [Alteromonadaceae bacterium]|jgi:phosphohistidine phosphatase SixA